MAASVYFIYDKVISRPDFDQMKFQFLNLFKSKNNTSHLIFLILLMFLNWLTETAKWRILLNRIQPINWLRGFRSVMSGVTVSVFTPNRIGEFAGRVMHLDRGSRIKAALAAVIGSMNQLMITIVAGGIGLLASLHQFEQENSLLYWVKFLLILTGIIAVIFIYFGIPLLSRIGDHFSKLRKVGLYVKVFALYPFSELLYITFLSMFRYFIFTFQFYLVLQLFDVDFPYFESLRLISLIYLVMALVPSIALSELTVRGSVTLYFLSPLTGNTTGILAATSFLWFLNLIIPAVLGALSVFYFRINK